ncbi:hypothetical protein [Aliihoeflea sp. PC F10.4]
MSWDQCRLIDSAIHQASEIASTPFQDAEPSWSSEAALALLLINLKDALITLKAMGHPITFTDDISDGKNITDLIATMRNTICHIGSPQRLFDAARNNSLTFGRVHGAGILLKTETLEIGSPYSDDVAFFYGPHRIFLVRHIYRAIREADKAFARVADCHNYQRRPRYDRS